MGALRRVWPRSPRLVAATTGVAIAVAAGPAGADDKAFGLVLSGTWLGTTRSTVTPSAGVGAECLMLGFEESRPRPWFFIVGGFVVAPLDQDDARPQRDAIDVHGRLGARLTFRPWMQPYAAAGLDALYVGTHGDMGPFKRGTTLGVSFTGGVLGRLGDHLLYTATVGYLGAIVPGTGDELDGLIVQLGLGLRMGEYRWTP